MTIKPFDIEVMPDPEKLKYLPEPDVKYGNIKDPVKREAKFQEAKEKQLEKIGLNPFYSRYFCGSFGLGQGKIIEEFADEAEVELIQWTFSGFGEDTTRIQTWNGKTFDIPFLFKRAMILGVNPLDYGLPPLSEFTKRYGCDIHQDLMLTLDPNNFIKLDEAARMLLGESKIDLDYKLFPALFKTAEGRAQILEYCDKDADLTGRLGKVMHNYLW